MSRWTTGLLAALTTLTTLTALAVDTTNAAASARPGSLTVRLIGLPSGQRPAALLRGPDGLRRSVSLRGLTIAKAPVGVYRLTLGSVRITRATGAIKRGALATALQGTVSVRVVAGHSASLEGDYSSIINPGLKALTGAVVSIAGPATDPSSVSLKGRVALTRGEVLSLPPSGLLPDGLLSNVLSVAYGPATTSVSVSAASVYEVAPNFQFDVPLSEQSPATVADVQAGCGGVTGILPYVTINDVSFSGGWDTVKVFGLHITDGVQAAVHFTAGAGVNVTAGAGLSCSLNVSFSANGMAGPIPVTAGIEGDLDGSAGAGGVLTTGGSIRIDAGAHTIGIPPALAWLPDVSFSSPTFTFTATTFAEATAGIGLTIRAGVGNSDIANVTLNVGASLDFDGQPGSCTWDAKFGQFSAEGTLLGWSITTPQTPALFTDPLWQSACDGEGGAPNPAGSGSTSAPGSRTTPVAPPRVDAGATHTCALSAGGGVDCWGDNEFGELGNGTTSASLVPVSVNGITNATEVSSGYYGTCALQATGSIDCWGDNVDGELGNGTTTDSLTPVPVGGITNATQVAAGQHYACALLATGSIDCWGYNADGELGDGAAGSPESCNDGLCSATAVSVTGITDATEVSVGGDGACALLATGDIACWGNDGAGELGDGTTTGSDCTAFWCGTPVTIGGITNAVQVSAGGAGACALLTSHSIDCWGDNGAGALGDGTFTGPESCGGDLGCSSAPVVVTGITNAIGITAGGTQYSGGDACAPLATGSIDCWGYNVDGELGNGSTINSDVAVVVSNLP